MALTMTASKGEESPFSIQLDEDMTADFIIKEIGKLLEEGYTLSKGAN
jgi:hypothetical protein